jgi:hypothetical protein
MILVNKLPDRLFWLCPTKVDDLIRLGGKMDGGYILPKSIVDCADALLSLGLGDDWTFDTEWKQYKNNDLIHMYDGTVTKDTLQVSINSNVRGQFDLPALYDSFFTGRTQHFVENVGNAKNQTSLATCLDRLSTKNVFIKMDIEGGEYPMINDFIANKDLIIGMAMEFHFCNTHRDSFQAAVNALQQHYEIVHVHANNHCGTGPEGLTDCLELTFVRQDLCTGTEKRRNFYLDNLDYSNVVGAEDYRYCF